MNTRTDHQAPPLRSILEPVPSSRNVDGPPPHPARAALVVTAIGYVLLTAVMLAIGFLLTHALDGSVGRWDNHVNRWFVEQRSAGWDHVTAAATWMVNTLPVVVLATVVVAFVAYRRRLREAAFLTIALLLEITVFLSVTFVVDRPRPNVPRLNATPTTSSFPSGHTAAATVLFAGIALVVTCCTPNKLARALSGVIAFAIVLTVGFGRVYRGLHHPSDVFAGALLGAACLTVAAVAVRAASVQVARRDARTEGGTVEVGADSSPRRELQNAS
jgi:undecaprenyl-diphosphatase